MSAYDIPIVINIGDKELKIRNNGDYRVILDCFAALNDIELTPVERFYSSLIIFYEDFNSIEDVNNFPDIESLIARMYWFFNCGDDSIGAKSHYKLIDLEKDAQLINSAINNVANKEIRSEPYVHWWTFMGYYTAIGECPLSYIVGIREKILKNKKLEKYEREFRRDNPQYFIWNHNTLEQEELQQEANEWLNQVWNKEEE